MIGKATERDGGRTDVDNEAASFVGGTCRFRTSQLAHPPAHVRGVCTFWTGKGSDKVVERVSDLFDRDRVLQITSWVSGYLRSPSSALPVLTSFWHSWNSRASRLFRAGLVAMSE